MSKKPVTFELKLDMESILSDHVDLAELQRLIEYEVNQKILPTIDKGISPVKSKRNFAKYKDKDNYPGKRKQSNKPNLALTGEMLSHYEVRPIKNELAVTIGIHNDAPLDVKTKANANQFGTKAKDGSVAIAARPFVPRRNEVYTPNIMLALRKAFATVLTNAFNKLKKRK